MLRCVERTSRRKATRVNEAGLVSGRLTVEDWAGAFQLT